MDSVGEFSGTVADWKYNALLDSSGRLNSEALTSRENVAESVEDQTSILVFDHVRPRKLARLRTRRKGTEMKSVYKAWYEHRSMGAVLDRAMEVKVFVVENNSTFLTNRHIQHATTQRSPALARSSSRSLKFRTL